MQVSLKHPTIAREGWLYIGISILLTLGVLVANLYLLGGLFALITLLLLFAFRDPERRVPSEPLGVVSPIDGTVTEISEKYNAVAEEQMLSIRINLNYLGVFSVRSPAEGKIVKQVFDADRPDPAYANWLQTDEGDSLVWELHPKLYGQPKCYVQTGERIGQGQRCGFSPFNAEVDLLIPSNSVVNVTVGTEVVAGQTILAKLIHQSGATIIPDPSLQT